MQEPIIADIKHWLTLNVCTPKEYTDIQIVDFVHDTLGINEGWSIRENSERPACAVREGCIHVILDC